MAKTIGRFRSIVTENTPGEMYLLEELFSMRRESIYVEHNITDKGKGSAYKEAAVFQCQGLDV